MLIKARKSSDPKLDYSQITVELQTIDGLVKDRTQCAPNGYYFIPVYDKGSFVVKVDGPNGWSWNPENVPITVDQIGCNLNADINFQLTGFGCFQYMVAKLNSLSCNSRFLISGKVKGAIGGESSTIKDGGPSGVKVELLSSFGDIVSSVPTSERGIYSFTNIVPVLEVLEDINDDGGTLAQKVEADALLVAMRYFDFIIYLHMMESVLSITNDLLQTRKDQNIVNAMKLVKISKDRLQILRDDGWKDLLARVSSFCEKHDVDVPSMDERYFACERSRRNVQKITNLYHYRSDRFYYVIDMQLQKLNNRFNETNTELLLCMTCLDLSSSFHAFDTDKLIGFATFYLFDFSQFELVLLRSQLHNYIFDMRSSEEFTTVIGIGGLAKKLVDTNKHVITLGISTWSLPQ